MMLPDPVRTSLMFAVAGCSEVTLSGFVSPLPRSTFTVTGLSSVAPRMPTDIFTGEPSEPRLDSSMAFTSFPKSSAVFTRKFSVRMG